MTKKSKVAKAERQLAKLRTAADEAVREATRAAKAAQRAADEAVKEAARAAKAAQKAGQRLAKAEAQMAVKAARRLSGGPSETEPVPDAAESAAPFEAEPEPVQEPEPEMEPEPRIEPESEISPEPEIEPEPVAGSDTAPAVSAQAEADGTGDLNAKTRAELLDQARRLEVPGRSRMNKEQLLEALGQYRQG